MTDIICYTSDIKQNAVGWCSSKFIGVCNDDAERCLIPFELATDERRNFRTTFDILLFFV